VFYSTSLLLLSYHIMSIPYLILFNVYLLAPACLCPRYDFQCMFMIRIYRYTCAYLCSPFDFHYHLLGSSDSPGSSCSGLGAWSMLILPVADQSGTVEAWIPNRPSRSLILQAPCSALEFSCYGSKPPFVLFILVHPLILAIAPIGDVIFF